MFFRAAVGVPLLLSSLASAALNGTYPASTTTNLNCATKMGKHSACPVPTCTKLWTVEAPPVIIPSYTQMTLTYTGNASTITSTETVQVTATVTDSTITDTFSTTSTEYDTITETISTTTTFTETDTATTTSTYTSSVPTASGFVPVSDTLNGYPGSQSQKRNDWSQLEARAANSTECGVPKDDYPQSVECLAEIMVQSTKLVTVTQSPTVTIITPAPSSTTVQSTTTSTSTIVPDDVSTTESFSTTETMTETATLSFTETATTTTTVEAAAATTVIAACAADNIVGPIDGRSIYNVFNIGPNAATIYDNAAATSAYDCCAQCFNKDGCTGSIYGYGRCLLMHNSARTCDSQSANVAYFVAQTGSGGYAVSNGNCGYLYDHGAS
ncbi:hypothetical protein BU16DRAFT_206517 [Lophium mytilinum]|uniref:Apple domain-containing protein n=1 Tax=Lophium mytilinum TaxID=390894 RepID=A0A6A6RAC5_9PEZI|nr:hypothetical protein BU16DRAFT_206517 [Lophium mytilinum]